MNAERRLIVVVVAVLLVYAVGGVRPQRRERPLRRMIIKRRAGLTRVLERSPNNYADTVDVELAVFKAPYQKGAHARSAFES